MEKRRILHRSTILAGGLGVCLMTGTGALSFTEPIPVGHSADGGAVYAANCSICHGRNGSGTAALRAKGQPDLSTAEWQRTHSDQQIVDRIRAGKGKMPAFARKLSDEQIMALVKQVRSFRK
jgi:mono/diheme cytochrome c family protein